ncbi:hypothetical protein AMECASPLE_039433 [Ameca splendens]|uniref:Uncharacterized protein n=1 Tax=Ameca splendens TaxID=208324 RepID=A0ABV0XXD0_9TELE
MARLLQVTDISNGCQIPTPSQSHDATVKLKKYQHHRGWRPWRRTQTLRNFCWIIFLIDSVIVWSTFLNVCPWIWIS